MKVKEKIVEYVARLPESAQAEVLDFVEHLLTKEERESVLDDCEWKDASLALAMRGMEDEEELAYSKDDIKEPFL